MVIGDVSGKGTRAAFYMTLVKGFLKALSRTVNSPADLLKEFETTADDLVLNAKLLSVCAYSNDHLSPDLNIVLEQVHNFVMTDETLLESEFYDK